MNGRVNSSSHALYQACSNGLRWHLRVYLCFRNASTMCHLCCVVCLTWYVLRCLVTFPRLALLRDWFNTKSEVNMTHTNNMESMIKPCREAKRHSLLPENFKVIMAASIIRWNGLMSVSLHWSIWRKKPEGEGLNPFAILNNWRNVSKAACACSGPKAGPWISCVNSLLPQARYSRPYKKSQL